MGNTNNTTVTASAGKMTWRNHIGYGVGQGGGGLIYTLGTTFLLVYYTNVAHIDPAISATIILVSKVLDGLSDLLMGYIIDRTRSRFGKARPWLLRFCFPTILCLIATFSVPESLVGVAQVAYVFITYNLFTTVCYTVITVSYNSLNSLITTDQYERGVNSIFGMTFYTIALLCLNMFMLKLTAFFGDGDMYSRKGWTTTVAVIAVAQCLLILGTFLSCRELNTPAQGDPAAGASAVKAKRPNVLIIWKMLFKNKYWVEYVLALCTVNISSVVIMGSAVFYAEFVLGDAGVYSQLSVALYVAMFIGIISTSVFIKKLGKRNTAIIGVGVLIAGTLLTGFLPQTTGLTAVTLAVRGFGVGFPSAIGAAILQDTLTYGKWKTGVDMVGMGNAASSFSAKIAGGVGTAIIGWVLSAGGFDSGVAAQSAGAKAAITNCFIWIPLIFVVVALFCFILYRLDKEYAGYITDMAEGRYGPEAVVPVSAETETKGQE
jgi:GPH family glycoside/pentoside/hexuronide:cation symporter